MNYLPAQIQDVGNAGGFICGFKIYLETLDYITLEFALCFVALDATDE